MYVVNLFINVCGMRSAQFKIRSNDYLHFTVTQYKKNLFNKAGMEITNQHKI